LSADKRAVVHAVAMKRGQYDGMLQHVAGITIYKYQSNQQPLSPHYRLERQSLPRHCSHHSIRGHFPSFSRYASLSSSFHIIIISITNRDHRVNIIIITFAAFH
jgi:hypothetical protein